jgi:hypothetical protein
MNVLGCCAAKQNNLLAGLFLNARVLQLEGQADSQLVGGILPAPKYNADSSVCMVLTGGVSN